jgi:hypothetical protein
MNQENKLEIPEFIQNFILMQCVPNNCTIKSELKKLKGEDIIWLDYRLNFDQTELVHLQLYTKSFVGILVNGCYGLWHKHLLVLQRNLE